MLGILGQTAQGLQNVGLFDKPASRSGLFTASSVAMLPAAAGWSTAGSRKPSAEDSFVRHLNPELHRVAAWAGNAGVAIPTLQCSVVTGILRPLGNLRRYLA